MKLLIFSIAILYWSVQAIDYNKYATDLNQRIGGLLVQFPVFQTTIGNALKDTKPIDFGINNDARIKQLQGMIKTKSGKAGIAGCGTKLDTGIKTIQQELQTLVKTKLNEQSANLKQYVANLTKIQNRLFGKNLKDELAACAGKESCPMNAYYKSGIDAYNFLTDHKAEMSSKELPSLYGKKYAAPEMAKKIDGVFKTVKGCVDAIK